MESCIVGYHKINALYVDSSMRRRKVLGDLFLSSFNFAFIASYYSEIPKIYKENNDELDLIIIEMDYDVNEKISILKSIRSENKFISIVVFSEFIKQDDLLKFIDVGVQKVILESNNEIKVINEIFDSASDINFRHEWKGISRYYEDINTGLENNEKLIKDIENKKDYAVIIINVDKFRKINEFYGYDIGDNISLQIIERIKKFIPTNDIFKIYKLQIDEYAILIRKRISFMNFDMFAKALYDELCEKEYVYDNNYINIAVSIGVAVNEKSNIKQDLLKNANFAIEHARKNDERFVVYSSEIENLSEDNFEIISIIKYAINNDKIHVYYQPIVNNKTRNIEKYEALVRMEDEHGNIYAPITFLGIAKQIKLYSYITKIVITKAIEKFSALPYKVSINLSVGDMMNEEIKKFIIDKLLEHPEMYQRLIFEILETESISNYDKISAFLDDIKRLGCKISIDDFGTGYSNFFNILKLNVDTIKIDGSIIKNVATDKNAQVITKAIVGFARELNIELVAEFVSTEEIYNKVNNLGIAYSQGYYFGKPVPENEI
ncbi:MAG: hypothetical protein A2Y24_01135 [Clostridiales bacterium GWE2_32_10]|nr:MAG: hypothetical protein A2Y24_01135 [Clostridiales bacterium GWE2_32_10]